jgi:hypothetical protein
VSSLARQPEKARKGVAVHILHDEEDLAPDLDDVGGRDDIRVSHASCEASLVEEHPQELGLPGEERIKPFYRDDT